MSRKSTPLDAIVFKVFGGCDAESSSGRDEERTGIETERDWQYRFALCKRVPPGWWPCRDMDMCTGDEGGAIGRQCVPNYEWPCVGKPDCTIPMRRCDHLCHRQKVFHLTTEKVDPAGRVTLEGDVGG